MASSGGHWVKVAGGNYAGTMVFVPKPAEAGSSASLYAAATSAYLQKTGSMDGAYNFLDDAQAAFTMAKVSKVPANDTATYGATKHSWKDLYSAGTHFKNIPNKEQVVINGKYYTGVKKSAGGYTFAMVFNQYSGTYQIYNNTFKMIKSFNLSNKALSWMDELLKNFGASAGNLTQAKPKKATQVTLFGG